MWKFLALTRDCKIETHGTLVEEKQFKTLFWEQKKQRFLRVFSPSDLTNDSMHAVFMLRDV